MTAIIQPNPYAPRPTVSPDVRMAAAVLRSRAIAADVALNGPVTTAGVKRAKDILAELERDLPGLRKALETV